MGNFLIQLRLGNQVDNLFFPEAEARIEGFFDYFGPPADGTDSVPAIGTEFLPTSKTVSSHVDWTDSNGGGGVHFFISPRKATIRTIG